MTKISCAVWMVTYNHEKYIEQAITSILVQQTDFEFRLFIGEDNSKDNTAAICRKYAEQYPDKITLFSNTTNLGPNANALNIYKACQESGAKYIALCEGDDYWSDPHKLQKQVALMEQDETMAFTFHKVKLLDELGENANTGVYPAIDGSRSFHLNDFILNNNAPTASLLMRTAALFPLPDWFRDINFGDWTLCIVALSRSGGHAYFLDEVMAVYRLHGTSLHGKLKTGARGVLLQCLGHDRFIETISRHIDLSAYPELYRKKRSIYINGIEHAILSASRKEGFMLIRKKIRLEKKLRGNFGYIWRLLLAR